MTKGFRIFTAMTSIGFFFALTFSGVAQNSSQAQTLTEQETMVTGHATGTFEVKLVPQDTDDKTKPAAMGRMTIDKQWHGDLDGTSVGQMLTGGTDVKTSGVYVAVEQFNGTLAGRKGTFLLHHTGLMTRGKPQLSISVVPDSGTAQLVGITGTMKIIITEGKHSYDFEYALPAVQ
jgi:hypothetical protein